MDLHQFADIHTHDPQAGDRAVINLNVADFVPEHGYYSIGMHPWDTATEKLDSQLLLQQAAKPSIVAIGETGLDAMRGAPLDIQEQIFIEHVRVSETVRKPLIIHAVRTLNRIIELRKQLRPTQLWIIHGFRGKPEQARQLTRAGIAISVGRNYNPEIIKAVPDSMLYHETDTTIG